jgi:hypothetical protein
VMARTPVSKARLKRLTDRKCGARIVPTAKEMKKWRLKAGLNQREMGLHGVANCSVRVYLALRLPT